MRNIFYVFILMLTLPFVCKAQGDENYRWETNLYAGIYIENEQAWIIEPSIAWHFHNYFGVAVGLEFTSQYNQPGRSLTINGQNANLTDNNKNIAWMLFKPAIILKSPTIKLNKEGDYKLWFQVEPGVSLACPFKNSVTYETVNSQNNSNALIDYATFRNKDLKVFYWNAKISAKIAIERWVLGLGYEVSDFDYYSCRRNITLPDGSKFYVPKKEISQSVLLSVGYKF